MTTPPCATIDPELFFAEEGTLALRAAKRICSNCELADTCLRIALTAEAGVGAKYRFGMYGGLTGRERARLARRPRPRGEAA